MNQREAVEEWLIRLRSGKYPQIKDALHLPGKGQCCLGVVSEIAFENGIVARELFNEGYAYGGCFVSLPDEVMELLGIDERGTFNEEGEKRFNASSLVELNDNQAKTFDEIADVIEEAYRMGYFREPGEKFEG